MPQPQTVAEGDNTAVPGRTHSEHVANVHSAAGTARDLALLQPGAEAALELMPVCTCALLIMASGLHGFVSAEILVTTANVVELKTGR